MTRSGWVDSIKLMPRTLLSAVPPELELVGIFLEDPSEVLDLGILGRNHQHGMDLRRPLSVVDAKKQPFSRARAEGYIKYISYFPRESKCFFPFLGDSPKVVEYADFFPPVF